MTQRFQLVLSPEEQSALEDLRRSESLAVQHRARIVLMTAAEVPQVTIAATVGLSERQVRRWQRAFQKNRMAIFAPGPGEPPAVEPPVDDAPGAAAPRRALRLEKKPGVLPDDPMSEAGRKILFHHFERMLQHEPGSRLGEDIEAVHDMRVATRRLRSAFRIFLPFYRRKQVRPLIDGLRVTGRALGAVRDMDVFLEKLGVYRASLPAEGARSLEPVIEIIEARREAARVMLLKHLNSPGFSTFVADFDRFVSTPGAGARKLSGPTPGSLPAYLVRHVAPRLIYTSYENVRAYETVLDHARIETLHALRIEFKRLRYALEFFEEVLGPEGSGIITLVKTVQDHLGDLNDAQVASQFLRELITEYEAAQSALPIHERRSTEHIIQYLAYQFAEKHRLMTTFPAAWEAFNRPEVRRKLALAVAAL